MIQHSFIPKIVRPTRIKKQSATLIDHIFTRDNLNCITSGIINTEIAGNCGYTDHFPIFIILATQRPKVKNKATYEKSFFTEVCRDICENYPEASWANLMSVRIRVGLV